MTKQVPCVMVTVVQPDQEIGKVREFFVLFVSHPVALYGVLLLGSHCSTISKPPKLSEATRLLATTPTSLFNAAEIKQNTRRMQSANYLKKKMTWIMCWFPSGCTSASHPGLTAWIASQPVGGKVIIGFCVLWLLLFKLNKDLWFAGVLPFLSFSSLSFPPPRLTATLWHCVYYSYCRNLFKR